MLVFLLTSMADLLVLWLESLIVVIRCPSMTICHFDLGVRFLNTRLISETKFNRLDDMS